MPYLQFLLGGVMTSSVGRRDLSILFLLCLAWAAPSTVRAESGIPTEELELTRLRRPNLPIPADGALLFLSGDFTVPVIEVRGPDGVLIEGELYEVGLDTAPLYAWKSTTTLAIGTHEILIGHADDAEREETATVEVVEPFSDELPPLETSPSATWQSTPGHRHCCSTPTGVLPASTCFAVSQEAFIRVQPGFLSAASQAVLNQFLFRVVPAGDDESAPPIYRPLEHPAHEALFHEAADSYCIEVRVLNIATREESVYSGLESCASHDNRELGENLPVEVDVGVFAIENGCLVPPPEYQEDWCKVNDGACDVAKSSECELYDFVCEGGPLPGFWKELADGGGVLPDFDFDAGTPDTLDGGTTELDASDASDMPMDPIDASFGPSASNDGCSVARPRASSSAGAGLGAALALLMLALRRGRLAPRRR